MNDPLMLELAELIRQSIRLWDIECEVALQSGKHNLIQISSGDNAIVTVSRAPHGMPFRWTVVVANRTRTAASINGVLRNVRQHFETDYAPLALTVAALPERHA